MKHLLLLTLLVASLEARTACRITFLKPTDKSKTAYIDGVSVSQKIRNALSSVCTVQVRLMNVEERIAHERAKFERKVKKLKAGK